MIYSFKISNENAFQEIEFPEYREKIKRTFIINFNFDKELYDKDYYGNFSEYYIYKWRDTNMKKITKTFEIELLKDIISSDENCREGYKKCGIVNEKRDYLCLKLDENEECPINKIIIDEDSYIFKDDYTTKKMGDKFVHFSNKKTDNYILINLNITENEIETKIDLETLNNLMKYNPELEIFFRVRNLYLNREYFKLIEKEKNIII